MTALHTAVEFKRLDIAGYLAQEGGKVEDKAPFGKGNSTKNALELMYLYHKDISLLDQLEKYIKSVSTANLQYTGVRKCRLSLIIHTTVKIMLYMYGYYYNIQFRIILNIQQILSPLT